MCIYSDFWLQWEKENLAPYAVHSDHQWYTRRCDGDKGQSDDRYGSQSRYRTAFEIDKDRITNSQAFRRLEYKTQVFVTHEGDNYRTRLTHSLEVSEIARHIARSLRLNEHLVEAIALGHDLGHAPYGHIAERTINAWLKSLTPPFHTDYHFSHNNHSVENVEHLEPGYDWDDRDSNEGFAQGLNLTIGIREGILAHTSMAYRGVAHKCARFNKDFEDAIRKQSDANRAKGLFYPGSLEAQTVRIADDIAQRIHDLEDGLRSGMLCKEDIRERLKAFFSELRCRMFPYKEVIVGGKTEREVDIDVICEGYCIQHIKMKTKVSKEFLDAIVSKFGYSTKNETIKQINDKLRDDSRYRDDFLLAAQVAFLLHMWRDDIYFSKRSDDEWKKAVRRVFKYLKFLNEMLGINQNAENKNFPAYHIIAFLRGCMLANVIEHSFWNIHMLLDPSFRTYEVSMEYEEYPENAKWYVVFAIVDGFTNSHKKSKLDFEKVKRDGNCRYCFTFDSADQMNGFIKDHFHKIMRTNGIHLKEITTVPDSIPEFKGFAEKLCWLNKSEDPSKTRFVKIILGGKKLHVRLENVRIYFTGYKDLCPGIKGSTCGYGRQRDQTCDHSTKCDFRSDNVRYPDANRLVDFQQHMFELDFYLKTLITEKIHHGSRIARMNYMGDKIIRALLDTYLNNPRLMHDRVWARLRVYPPDMQNISLAVQEWIDKPIDEKEKSVLSEGAFRHLTQPIDSNYKNNRFSLVRRIIEHVAGMTDRYISNEYNRINQSGRETELQDETYFFY